MLILIGKPIRKVICENSALFRRFGLNVAVSLNKAPRLDCKSFPIVSSRRSTGMFNRTRRINLAVLQRKQVFGVTLDRPSPSNGELYLVEGVLGSPMLSLNLMKFASSVVVPPSVQVAIHLDRLSDDPNPIHRANPQAICGPPCQP